MGTHQVTTVIPYQLERSFSPRAAGEFAQKLEASGVVDYFQAWDQLTLWWPNALWRPDVTPLANIMNDCLSWPDAFLTGAFAAAATENLGITISTDAVRRGPAELMQTMLGFAQATDGRASLTLGAGEIKQARPFGWRRAEGLDRLEDLFQLFRALWETEGPFDFEGNHWKFRKAWLGSVRQNRPKFHAMGGGPRLMEIATRYADGFSTVIPNVIPTPEKYAQMVQETKRGLEWHGRDPENYEFGAWFATLIHDDADFIDRALDNQIIKFYSAHAGRLNQADWAAEGLEPILPQNYHYAMKLLPNEMSRAEVDDIVSKVPRRMAEKSFIVGSCKEVASTIQEFIDAGATWISINDLMNLELGIERDDPMSYIEPTLQVCQLIKKQPHF